MNEMVEPPKNPMGWRKVDMNDFRRAMEVLAEADPNDRKSVRAALKRANAICGVTAPARQSAAPPPEGDE